MSIRLASGSAAAVLLAAAGLTAVVAPAAQAATGGSRTVSYQGYQLQVPDSWQVVDLAQNPRTCVRFDQNTVYLGTPGATEDCPAHLAPGRTDALVLQPTPAPVKGRPAAPVLNPGAALSTEVLATGAVDHEVRAQLRGTGLQLTASYGADTAEVNAILATGKATGTAPAAAAPAAPRSTTAPRATTVAPRTDGYGQGFDACTAPSQSSMTAWQGSYSAVGIYIGGPLRACSQPNLTADWVAAQASAGWSFMPIYVGSQATLYTSTVTPIPTDQTQARSRGNSEGSDAATQATTLGFTPGAVLYNDMENYTTGTYTPQVLSYLSGWIDSVHAAGFQAGVYSSANSGISDLAANYNNSAYSRPDAVWSASWNNAGDTSEASMGLPSSGYWPGKRVHQYASPGNVTVNGVTIGIDQDFMNVSSQATGTSMESGTRMDAGTTIASASMQLTMQSDGNLVEYKIEGGNRGPAMWSSQTGGNPGAYALMQRDGNLVIYRANGTAAWATSTYVAGGYLQVQDDGNVVVYQSHTGPAEWGTGTYKASTTIATNQSLTIGRWTQSALVQLVMQGDGNLVIYRNRDGAALWSTNTSGNSGAYVLMQPDGNLVVYKAGGGPSTGGALWSSNTSWAGNGSYALLQDDGNFVVYQQGGGPTTGKAAWSTGTQANAA